MHPDDPQLILASGSPRRRQLLADLGVDFSVRPVDADESILAGETPEALVQRLAAAKSKAQFDGRELVLAADTVVVIDGEILGKPADKLAAREMLRRLSGRKHTVFSGVALTLGSTVSTRVGFERSEVEMVALDGEEIEWYVDTGEPLDKAGSYAIQGLGALFVATITGNYSNVVGLPLPLTQSLFRDLGFDLRRFRRGEGD